MQPPLRILHLEDNPTDAELIQAILETEGIVCDVTRVDTQADFTASIEHGGFDLILTDYTLPSFDGLSALRIAQEKSPDVPFIFVSGTLGEEVAIEALKVGATDYILKQRLPRIVPSVHRALREAKEIGERRRAEALLSEEKRLLEMIAKGNGLSRILYALCRLVEELSEDSLASILLLDPDGNRLWHGAAPSLPKGYTEAIDGGFIGPAAGSCGTAAYRREPVIVSDIATDPLWINYRDLALPHGLRACWSTPVLASDGRVLGTFAIYSREPRSPTSQQLDLIKQITDLASIAIERKRAEEERQAHLWFLESMDQVNRAIQGTNDLEQMMSDVLDTVLSIFDCDRAWLVYPCDPEAPSWKVPMEHARPEFPGAFALGLDLPVDPDIAKVFRTVRAASAPVRFGPASENPLPAEIAQHFSIQSIIAMAVYPKGDRPYMLGLHQCSYPRVWTPREERLFQEIGRRLEDALTTLLMFRNLRESERKLEEAQRLAQVGYWERDPDTGLITWSDETYRIFGLSPQERILNFAQLPELVHPEDKQRVVETVAMALCGGPRYDIEYRVVRPNGEVRVVHSQGDVMRDDSGRPRRMFGTVQDITERKRAEEELRRSEADLRKVQAELAHVTRLTTMGELTASIAHEVNQPLTAVIANANASLRWLAAATPNLDEARQAVSRIVRDGNRARDVIARIRALVEKTDTEKVPLDINQTVHEVVILMQNEAVRKGVALRTDLAADVPPVRGDRVQLQQVTLNLVMNGVEAMALMTDRPRELLIRSRPHEADKVLVAVQDCGVGIDSQNIEKVFDAFYTTKSQGMGMGLAISRSIVENHGGKLWAVPNPGPGTTFQFTLLKCR